MHAERLRQLANHLKSDKLGHDKFDFSTYCVENSVTCKSAACALGEAVTLWPEHWIAIPLPSSDGDYRKSFAPILRVCLASVKEDDISKQDVNMSAAHFFNITMPEVEHLFYPWNQDTRRYGGLSLLSDATKDQVADNILKFISRKEAADA